MVELSNECVNAIEWGYLGRWLQIDPDDRTNSGQAEYGR